MKIYKLAIALGMIGGAFNSTFSAYGDNPPVNPYQPDPNPIRQIAGYEYAWGDEFNVDGVVNPDLWQAEEGFIRGNELQYYRRENAVVKDRRLLITGKKERVKNKFYDASSGDYRKNTEYSEYTSASILGKDKRHFLFGRIEVRARIHPADGAFPAVWTCGYNKNWPSNGEIDMMEYYLADLGNGKEPVLTTNFCVSSDNPHDAWAQNWKSVFTPVTYYQKKDKDWMNKYHVYRMDWDEESIALYVDDELRNWINIDEFRNGDGSIAFHNPQFMMLNLAIKNHGAGLVDDYAFEVDYFRVYQKKPDLVKPSMVEGLKVLKQTATTCTLQWQPSTDNQGIYRYDIYKEGGRFVGSTTDCEFVIDGVSSDDKVKYYVRALDAAGNYSDRCTPLSVFR